MDWMRRVDARAWWAAPVGIFVLMRAITAGFMVSASGLQGARSSTLERTPPAGEATYWDLVTNWDAYWYFLIAREGYPTPLPLHPTGEVAQNAWAFYPAWPKVIEALAFLPGPVYVWAGLVAPLLALGGLLLIYREVLRRTDRRTALYGFTWMSLVPMAAVTHMAYTEGLTLLLLGLLFTAVSRGAYGWALLPMTALALTRPIVAATGLMALMLWAYRWRRAKRGSEEFPRRDRYTLGLLGAYGIASFGLWPLICALATGRWDGYLATQERWSLFSAGNLFTYLTNPVGFTPWPLVFYGALALGLILAWRHGREPIELKLWACAYSLFLLLTTQVAFYTASGVFVPEALAADVVFHGSLLRYSLLLLLPLIPLSLIDRVPRGPLRAGAYGLLALGALALTYLYVTHAIAYNLAAGLFVL